MTAEIAIMNRQAVALAADSAVTINTASGRKIYNTVNKLFALTKHAPVGIMVYGRADLSGIPWESIIKTYRDEARNKTFDELEQYVSDFLAFIRNAKHIFSEEIQRKYFDEVTSSHLTAVRTHAQRKIQTEISTYGAITEERIGELLDLAAEEYLKHLASLKLLVGVSRKRVNKLRRKQQRAIQPRIKTVFQKLPISEKLRKKLLTIISEAYCRRAFNNSDSGVVIAGFGNKQIFPELHHIVCGGVGEGILRCEILRTLKITHDDSAVIKPFAQSEMVETFMEGVDPSYQTVIDSYWQTITSSFPDEVINALQNLSDPEKNTLRAKLEEAGKRILGDFKTKLREYQREQHIQPVVNAIDVLPKDLLAEVAESLVNLTSFKRRISMTSAETVGGPIDVAVISRGDGFIWIKRKHYFKPEMNPRFLAGYNGGSYATQKEKS